MNNTSFNEKMVKQEEEKSKSGIEKIQVKYDKV